MRLGLRQTLGFFVLDCPSKLFTPSDMTTTIAFYIRVGVIQTFVRFKLDAAVFANFGHRQLRERLTS